MIEKYVSDHSSAGRAWDCRNVEIPGSPDQSRLVGFFSIL